MAGVGASPREGLVAAQRTVDRGGQTHEQRYWVKPAEIRDMVWKTLGFPRTAAKLHPGVDAVRADLFTRAWVRTGIKNQVAALSAAARLALADDLQAVAMERAEVEARVAANERANLGKTLPTGAPDASTAWEEGAKDVDTLAALATVAQAFYDEPEVTLYRGVGKVQAEELRAAFQTGDAVLDTGCLVSMTEDPKVAREFASRPGDIGVVISFKVPREAIVLSYRADMISERHEAEAEVAVLTRGAIRVNAGQVTPGGF